ncbi:protein ORF1 [Lizard adenovirus 2]|uniref:Protein ORF1 n=1 Tax=Lizard adenovirus 2 TaxID=874272 RepID=A0A076FT45_9ADEN|nr:protein ORF1 [Lizard adenovirus 2]AII22587.1 protein ORF1 [Lizard adenovirus 2]
MRHLLVNLATLLSVSYVSGFPLNITLDERIPYTQKNLTWWTDDFEGKPVVSLCTRMSTNRAEDGQRCHPLPFWLHVCDAQVEDAFKYMDQFLDEDNFDEADFTKACIDYHLTWPHCESRKDKKALCKLWKRVHPFERKYLTLFYGQQ